MKTAAAIARSLRTPFVVEVVEQPDLQDTDVLVRIVAGGVCHTDLAQGRFPCDKFARFYPFAEINRAVEDQRNGIAIKPILEVAAA